MLWDWKESIYIYPEQYLQATMYKNIAPFCYLTIFGFGIVGFMYNTRKEKRSVDRFHLRQSFGLYVTGFCCYALFRLFNMELVLTNLPYVLVIIPLFILWLLGLISAIEEKTKPIPIVGALYQKWFAFVAREPKKPVSPE